MSFCSSPERKTIFLPFSGFGAFVGPSQVVCGPAYLATAALASETASAKAGAHQPARKIAQLAMSARRLNVAFIVLPPSFVRAFDSDLKLIDWSACRRSLTG